MDKGYCRELESEAETKLDKMQRRVGDIIRNVWRAAADSALPLLKIRLHNDAEAIRICEQTKAEQADGNIHAYFNMYFSTKRMLLIVELSFALRGLRYTLTLKQTSTVQWRRYNSRVSEIKHWANGARRILKNSIEVFKTGTIYDVCQNRSLSKHKNLFPLPKQLIDICLDISRGDNSPFAKNVTPKVSFAVRS